MLIPILVLLILTGLNAFFAASEIAFISLNDNKIEKQAKEGNKKAKYIAKMSAKVSDANALDKNPASVIPICIVAKNLLGVSNIFSICLAFLFPSLAIFSILVSFKEINAISLAAKKAFIPVNIINTNIGISI